MGHGLLIVDYKTLNLLLLHNMCISETTGETGQRNE